MKTIVELVKYITQAKLAYPKIIRKSGAKTNLEKLYHHIKNGKDATAEAFLPNTPNQDKYFSRIKNELENRLINSMLFIESDKDESNLEKARHHCYKVVALVNRLKGKQFSRIAAKEAEKTINIAIEYDLTSIIYELASFLQYYHGSFTGNKTKLEYYTKLVNQAVSNLMAETQAQNYLTATTAHYVNQKSIIQKVTEQAESYLEKLEKLSLNVTSTRFHLLKYYLMIFVAEMKSEHQKVIHICNEASRFLESKKSCANAANFVFQFKKVPALMYKKDFKTAEATIEECIKNSTKNVHNYNIMLIYRAFLGFHSNNQKMTEQAFFDFKQQKTTPTKNLIEQITILEAFYCFNVDNYAFEATKFLKEVPIFSKDKRGNNINILIGQILLLLKERSFDIAENRIDALQSYAQRNLIKNADFRSNCFIKMLATLPVGSFHRVRVEPRAKKYINKILTMPVESANQPFELEVIQYEILWEKILVLLD